MCVWNLKYFDELFTVETVKQSLCFRLLAQLRDMESAFDGFFEKHHLKLHQYLQLLRYEQSFQEVRIPSILSHVYIFSCASQQVCCGLLFIFSLCLSKGFCFLFRWSCVWTIWWLRRGSWQHPSTLRLKQNRLSKGWTDWNQMHRWASVCREQHLFTRFARQMSSPQTHFLCSSVCGSVLALSGGDDPSSDHHPSRTPAVSRSPLRHGADYAALQWTSPLLWYTECCSEDQTHSSSADTPAAALSWTGTHTRQNCFMVSPLTV